MDELKNNIDLDEKQVILKQFENISDKNYYIFLLEKKNEELNYSFNELQHSWSYKIGRLITKTIYLPVDMFKNFIKFSAKIASHFPWFINFVKKMIHLIPPLESKVLSIIDPSSVNNTPKEDLILTEDGQKIYDELMMRIEKQK